jgi:hypothetical protein
VSIEVSNTEFNTFMQCRRRWYITYYLKMRPKERGVTGPLQLGSRVHSALERFYKHGDDLIEAHRALFEKDHALAVAEGFDVDALESEGELGQIMLEGYLDWLDTEGYDDDAYDIIGSEEILKMPLLDGALTVIGKLDLRVFDKRQNVVLIRDFKTVASFESYTKWAHLNPQLLTYMTLDYVNTEESERIAGGEFHLLKKVKRGPRAKPPFYERHEIRHNVFALRSFWKRLHGVARDLMAVREALDNGADHREVAYPHATRDCTWICPAFHVCPLFDDGSDVKGMLEADFEEANPYDYYGDEETE